MAHSFGAKFSARKCSLAFASNPSLKCNRKHVFTLQLCEEFLRALGLDIGLPVRVGELTREFFSPKTIARR